MRITIDISEPEGRSTIITREGAAQQTGTAEAPATDGGQPPEALMLALGAKAEAGAEGTVARDGDIDAGKPPSWLVDVIPGRGGPN